MTGNPTVPQYCRHAWHDGKQSHICYLPANHEPPCKCSGCTAVEGEPPKQGTAGGSARTGPGAPW